MWFLSRADRLRSVALIGLIGLASAAQAASPTWTTLTSSANPTIAGQSVTFTAAVKVIGGGGPPTGSVTFQDAAAVLGSAALDGSGVATLSTAALLRGTHPITALYVGDASFAASASEALLQATPASGVCSPSFFTAAWLPTFSPTSVASGDFNQDGKLDIVATAAASSIPVFLGDGEGGFTEAPGSPVATGFASTSVVVRDFNLDGKLDLAVSIGGLSAFPSNRIDILLGNGSGGFAPAPGSPLLVGPNQIGLRPRLAAGDFNLDGKPDLAVRHAADNTVAIELGDGNGGFTAAGPAFSAGSAGLVVDASIAVADFNLDGRPDIILGGDPITILLGDGAGAFGPGLSTGASGSPVLGDFNGDGRLDFAHTPIPAGPNLIETVLGDGAGGFGPAPGPAVATFGFPVSGGGVGDVNGDGKPDFPIAFQSSSKPLGLMIGDGLGGFTPTSNIPGLSSFGFSYILAGDFKQDGRIDFVGIDTMAARLVSVASNCDATATTTVVSSAPNPSAVGQSVSLTATTSPASGPGTPTGQIQFLGGGQVLNGSTVQLVGGVATLDTSALNNGVHNITAVYSGDANFLGSTSAPTSHTVLSRVTINDVSANSSLATTLTFNVTLSVASALSVTMEYATSDHTALAGINYTTTSGTLTFEPGETLKTISIPVPKGTPGPSKDFFLALSHVSNATFSRATGIGTINYSDPGALTLYVDDPSLKEGNTNGGVTLLGFTLSLSKAATSLVTVDYATANATATAGTDYTSKTGTIVFTPGKTTRTILVPILGNTTVDANRTFFVNLTNVTGGATPGKAQGTGSIIDDDPSVPAIGAAQLRLHSPTTFEHLYTTDTNEYAVLATRGWIQEGTAYTLFQNAGSFGASSAIPVYRLYHPGVQQHHWTTDANEVTVLATGFWDYEGISGYILPGSEPGTVPLFRLSLARPALHLWTTDANEKLVLSTQRGWIYEGLLGYVVP